MELKNLKQDELELMSYTDITNLIIKETKKAQNTAQLFKQICSLLEYSEEDFSNKIGDYYTSLTLDKRFVLLETNEWDLRDHHNLELEIDEEENEEEIDEIEEEIEDDEEIDDLEEPIDDEEIIDEDIDEDIDDLSIVDEDELED